MYMNLMYVVKNKVFESTLKQGILMDNGKNEYISWCH